MVSHDSQRLFDSRDSFLSQNQLREPLYLVIFCMFGVRCYDWISRSAFLQSCGKVERQLCESLVKGVTESKGRDRKNSHQHHASTLRLVCLGETPNQSPSLQDLGTVCLHLLSLPRVLGCPSSMTNSLFFYLYGRTQNCMLRFSK